MESLKNLFNASFLAWLLIALGAFGFTDFGFSLKLGAALLLFKEVCSAFGWDCGFCRKSCKS